MAKSKKSPPADPKPQKSGKASKSKATTPSPPTTPTPKRSLWRTVWRWLVLPCLVLVVSFHLLVVGLLLVWGSYPVTNSMFMTAHRLGGGDVSQTWVEYKDIAKSAKQASIASEDARFVKHNGFDLHSIELAIKANEQAGAVSMGGSTITQQLAKNLFLSSHRSYLRKAEEAIITVMIENMWSKQRILAVYLNVVEFGDGIYGIEQASRHYYHKSAKHLTDAESALLISMLPNPKYYQHHLNSKRLQNKKRIILQRMPSAMLPQ